MQKGTQYCILHTPILRNWEFLFFILVTAALLELLLFIDERLTELGDPLVSQYNFRLILLLFTSDENQ